MEPCCILKKKEALEEDKSSIITEDGQIRGEPLKSDALDTNMLVQAS